MPPGGQNSDNSSAYWSHEKARKSKHSYGSIFSSTSQLNSGRTADIVQMYEVHSLLNPISWMQKRKNAFYQRRLTDQLERKIAVNRNRRAATWESFVDVDFKLYSSKLEDSKLSSIQIKTRTFRSWIIPRS